MKDIILIVEDEPDISNVLDYKLRKEGYATIVAETGEEALHHIRLTPPQLVLLDLMLPGISGLEVARKMREHAATKQTPIIMLTARGEEFDRILGFESGVDDYVVKPFSIRELILRIQAVLRRSVSLPKLQLNTKAIVIGELLVDQEAHRVLLRDEELSLTFLEFKLLFTLVSRRGRAQSRATLLEDVWEYAPDVSSRTVDTHIKRLREKLLDYGDKVETVRGIGYRFSDTSN